jgi:hypothetical protein
MTQASVDRRVGIVTNYYSEIKGGKKAFSIVVDYHIHSRYIGLGGRGLFVVEAEGNDDMNG